MFVVLLVLFVPFCCVPSAHLAQQNTIQSGLVSVLSEILCGEGHAEVTVDAISGVFEHLGKPLH